MKHLSFGREPQVFQKRPVVCTDHDGIVIQGVGEPQYTVCETCRRLRGAREMHKKRNPTTLFNAGTTRRKK